MEQGDHAVTVNGLTAWFKVRGVGPLCLLPTPGWGASADLYFETMRPLEEKFTMVYLDTRGSGRSQHGLPRDAYRVANFLADLDEVRRLLGVAEVWVMGHSLGGLLAQMFALAYPQSCAGLILIDSLAALDSDHAADHEAGIRRRRGEAWYPAANAAYEDATGFDSDEGFKAFFEAVLPFYFHDVSKMATIRSPLQAETLSAEAYTTMAVNSAEFARGALERLHEITVPTVVVVGDDDFICSPRQAMRIHRGIRRSKLIVVENAGHMPWIEQPDAFYGLLGVALESVGSVSTAGG